MRSKTVLDHVRPTVVVRRRIYDASQFHDASVPPEASAPAAAAPPVVGDEPAPVAERHHAFLPTQSWGTVEEDESGPPSSVNVARALASLRADELQRVEELLREDGDGEGGPLSRMPASRAPTSLPPVSLAPRSTAHVPVPVVRLPSAIPLVALAERLAVAPEDLVTALVTGGFFSVARTSRLERDVARHAAELFGWRTEDMSAEEEAAWLTEHAPRRARSAAAKKPAPKAATKKTKPRRA